MPQKNISNGNFKGLKIIALLGLLIAAFLLVKFTSFLTAQECVEHGGVCDNQTLNCCAGLTCFLPDGQSTGGCLCETRTCYFVDFDKDAEKCVYTPLVGASCDLDGGQAGECVDIRGTTMECREPCQGIECFTVGRDTDGNCIYQEALGADCDLDGDGTPGDGKCQRGFDGELWCVSADGPPADCDVCDHTIELQKCVEGDPQAIIYRCKIGIAWDCWEEDSQCPEDQACCRPNNQSCDLCGLENCNFTGGPGGDLQKCVPGTGGANAQVYRCASDSKWRPGTTCPTPDCDGNDCYYPPQNAVIQSLACPQEACYSGGTIEVELGYSVYKETYITKSIEALKSSWTGIWSEGKTESPGSYSKPITIDCDDLLGIRSADNNLRAKVESDEEFCTINYSAVPEAPVLTHSGDPADRVIWQWQQVKGRPTEYRIYNENMDIIRTMSSSACYGSNCSWHEPLNFTGANQKAARYVVACNVNGCSDYLGSPRCGDKIYEDMAATPIEAVERVICSGITKTSISVTALSDGPGAVFSNLNSCDSGILFTAQTGDEPTIVALQKGGNQYTFNNLTPGAVYQITAGPAYNAARQPSGSFASAQCTTLISACDQCGDGIFNPCGEAECQGLGDGSCYFWNRIWPIPNQCLDKQRVTVQVKEVNSGEPVVDVSVKAVMPGNFISVYDTCQTPAIGECILKLPPFEQVGQSNTKVVIFVDDEDYSCDGYACAKLLSASELTGTVVLNPRKLNTNCFDSDYGQNWGTKGAVVLADGTRCVDYCEPSEQRKLHEYYCQDGDIQSASRECLGDCNNGRCVGEVFVPKRCSHCGPPDICTKEKCYSLGNCLFTKTSILGGTCVNSPSPPPVVDLSSDLNCLLEGVDFCPNDTDANRYYPLGANRFRKGTATDRAGQQFTDECQDFNPRRLAEMWCSDGDYFGGLNTYISYGCDHGCYDGACRTFATVHVKDFFTGDRLAQVRVEARRQDNNELTDFCITEVSGACRLELATEHRQVISVVNLTDYECNTPECPKEALPAEHFTGLIDENHGLSITLKPKREGTIIPAGCSDSDITAEFFDGRNYFQKGTVTDQHGSYYDVCGSTPSILQEQICQGGYHEEVTYDCGDAGCWEGSCGIKENCDDGTALNSCAAVKPLYCQSDGRLVNKCSLCKCPEGQTCQADDTCQPIACSLDCPDQEKIEVVFRAFEKMPSGEKVWLSGVKFLVYSFDNHQLIGTCAVPSGGTLCRLKICPYCTYYAEAELDGYITFSREDFDPAKKTILDIRMHKLNDIPIQINCQTEFGDSFRCVTWHEALSCSKVNGVYHLIYDIEPDDQYRYCLDETLKPHYYCLDCGDIQKNCDDGTALNSCSLTKPLYCQSDGVLVNKCAACGCPAGLTCQTDGSCAIPPPTKCPDNTLVGQCSLTKPFYCQADGNLIRKCAACGCPAGLTCQTNGSCAVAPPTKCSDGTALNTCSAAKPFYCQNDGTLVNKCSICGCPAGEQCQANETCQGAPPSECTDGTPADTCSVSKPLYCDSNLSLVQKCSTCGCPTGLFCKAIDQSCQPPPPSKCSDGTPGGECSASQPYFCAQNDLVLYENCNACGCPAPSICKTDIGLCEPPPPPCLGGVASGECSPNQPLRCLAGSFINDCRACGCPSGKDCQTDGSCQIAVDPYLVNCQTFGGPGYVCIQDPTSAPCNTNGRCYIPLSGGQYCIDNLQNKARFCLICTDQFIFHPAGGTCEDNTRKAEVPPGAVPEAMSLNQTLIDKTDPSPDIVAKVALFPDQENSIVGEYIHDMKVVINGVEYERYTFQGRIKLIFKVGCEALAGFDRSGVRINYYDVDTENWVELSDSYVVGCDVVGFTNHFTNFTPTGPDAVGLPTVEVPNNPGGLEELCCRADGSLTDPDSAWAYGSMPDEMGCENNLVCACADRLCLVAIEDGERVGVAGRAGICVRQGDEEKVICSLTSWTNLGRLISNLVKWLFYLALIVAPLLIVIGAFLFVSSKGEPAKVTQARRIIIWAAIGLAVILLARAVYGLVKAILT